MSYQNLTDFNSLPMKSQLSPWKYYVPYVSTDLNCPVYTYKYDSETNILTQYKNGVESVRMFVPDKFSLKESL